MRVKPPKVDRRNIGAISPRSERADVLTPYRVSAHWRTQNIVARSEQIGATDPSLAKPWRAL